MPRPRTTKRRSRDIVSPLRDDQYDSINAEMERMHAEAKETAAQDREDEQQLQEAAAALLRPARVAAGERCG